jgi:hypothetical protein
MEFGEVFGSPKEIVDDGRWSTLLVANEILMNGWSMFCVKDIDRSREKANHRWSMVRGWQNWRGVRFIQEKWSMVDEEKRRMMCHAMSTSTCHAMSPS